MSAKGAKVAAKARSARCVIIGPAVANASGTARWIDTRANGLSKGALTRKQNILINKWDAGTRANISTMDLDHRAKNVQTLPKLKMAQNRAPEF